MPIRYSSVVGGSGGTGFNLDVGSSGNTTFYFDTPQPAGGYSITSQAADTSIEFYAIAEDGTLAGYTNTKALSATKDFDTLVVYGATTNDLITFEYKSTTLPTASGDQDSGAAPYIDSISDADLASIDDTTIITGGNFATDVVVTFTGTDSVVRNAKSVVRTDSAQLIITRPDEFLEDNSPYTLTVSNPGITQSAIVTNTSPITAGGDPVWSTSSGSLTEGTTGTPYSFSLAASDPDSGAIVYAVVSGSLPPGLSLNANTGEISGTPTGSGSSFVISATDPGNNSVNRSFSIPMITATGGTVSTDGQYAYHTFTSSGTFQAALSLTADILVVAGGGGGGQNGGGGGAGGLISTSIAVGALTYPIVIGAGGPGGGSQAGQDGSNTTVFSKTALGGGGGAGGSTVAGRPGGSGGGVLRDSSASGGAETQPTSASGGFGNPGGSGQANTYAGGGGGGGASSAGGMGPPSGPAGPGGNPGDYYAGSGGAGLQWLDGNHYAGGGGGAAFQMVPGNLSTYGLGGIGGGGQGANDGENRAGYNTAAYFRDAVAGTANTGGGGGGALTYSFGNSTPKAGGSGIVIIRYPI